ncbi:MAG: aminopeptidase P family protein [Candidatus Coproplasma sp.]
MINRTKKVFDCVNADALVVEQEDLRFYLTGFASSFGIVICDGQGAKFYTDSRYIEAAKKSLDGSGIIVLDYPKDTAFSDLLSGYKTIAMALDAVSANQYNKLVSKGFTIVDCTNAFKNAMSVKDEGEIENIKLACQVADRAFEDLLPLIKEGMTENQVAAQLEFLMRKHGASGTSFETICAFGANASVPHHETGNTVLKFGDPILIDFGCKINGYCSDCTRTFLFGDDGNHEDFKEVYEKVLTAHMLVKERFAEGMTGCEGDAIARDYLKQHGLDKYFTHSLGHSLGINIHESPNLTPRDNSIFKDGMVFSDEPGVYIEGKLGIRIEDTVMLSGGKVISLTNTDKNLLIL